ncbi:rhodanese-related sulfurtransferase [Mangrovicella endophytica]|uniref:oxygen-dependent tRNA uridine(34) hydroxylase TrhO n=1 Tax=Mangrovicella endophytica TaxID=2066697 RepID=UPI000C9DBDE9|nr:rhodanese-related sulfurtransferase [Mangrovicella endophytica]
MSWTVAAFYRFVTVNDLPASQAAVRSACEAAGACGTILLAGEGINGTVAAPTAAAMDALVAALDAMFGIRAGEVKFSAATKAPFKRLKIRIRPEIITMRAPEADPSRQVGTYVEPRDWNALISDPDVLLIDTRNDYETAVGTFQGAVDPQIATFTAFKDFVATELDPEKHRKVAMFCTGGIRCEKASAYLLAHGFQSVFHLKGGILQYLEDVPQEESLWDGACYVFDGRTAVGHAVAETGWDHCFGCGRAVSQEDRRHAAFEEGVSCPACAPSLHEDRAGALRRRHAAMTRQGSR